LAQAERELAAPKTAKESHKLQQRYGGYGGYYGGYGGYGGYYSGYGGYDNYGYYGDESGRQFDDYGNEITEAEDTGDAIPEGEEVIKPLDYYENMIYGIIDGTSGDFDTNCRDSLYGIVGGGFAAYKYITSLNQLTQSSSRWESISSLTRQTLCTPIATSHTCSIS